jgi:hypothetical protein
MPIYEVDIDLLRVTALTKICLRLDDERPANQQTKNTQQDVKKKVNLKK